MVLGFVAFFTVGGAKEIGFLFSDVLGTISCSNGHSFQTRNIFEFILYSSNKLNKIFRNMGSTII